MTAASTPDPRATLPPPVFPYDENARVALPDEFAGFPYLVTRIGHSTLRDVAILPADWPRARLYHLARRQAQVTGLENCLLLGPSDLVFFSPDGAAAEGLFSPSGSLVFDKIPLPASIIQTDEMGARFVALYTHWKRFNPEGALVGDGLAGGRQAAAADLKRLSGAGPGGIPNGLSRCSTCNFLAGEYLALHGEGDRDMTPRVLQVHCVCENHNRCARCGETLYDSRLSAYSYNEKTASVSYVAAYAAFLHRCD